jgi:hypothetical protein
VVKLKRAAPDSNRNKLDAGSPLASLQTTSGALLLTLAGGYIDIVGYLSVLSGLHCAYERQYRRRG